MRNGCAIATFFIIDISSSSRNKSLIILACQIVLQIDIRSGNQIILSDRKALLRSRVAVIFDKVGSLGNAYTSRRRISRKPQGWAPRLATR
jgi:hypothetical protein